ncbi:hypothetical protein [Falsibacillus pallidus]|uniref:Lipoprotein n=1 Tax=Falsibacillus pallidus TaxID=493781 RepID=A0A370G0J9_9BACI|nr:hypothetical protein [Falsibacillus pallidus]RDI37265.1 hypothetical protein DFR59_12255 [Falsibacillus pallidus]
MKRKLLLALLLVISVLTACSSSVDEIKDSPLYNGRKLVIGVVGNAPEVREKNIEFKKLTLDDLKKENLSAKYDAVFIMKKYLSEASEAPYAKIYRNAGVPFFFMGSKKSYVPFVDEEVEYKDYPDTGSAVYADGYYESGIKGSNWEFGLYNDAVNKVNVQDVYSRIFTKVDSIDDHT